MGSGAHKHPIQGVLEGKAADKGNHLPHQVQRLRMNGSVPPILYVPSRKVYGLHHFISAQCPTGWKFYRTYKMQEFNFEVSSQTEMTYVNKITNAIKRNKSFHYRL
jgi:hypothetical protein